MQLYKYYQIDGGTEEWKPIQANISLETVRPTFVTILATDKIADKTFSREQKEGLRYYGPMYWDLDSSSISDSIEAAKELVFKLKELDLTDDDIEIFLSGKKGLHILVSPFCFLEKQQPMLKLPAVFKEVAFKLAVDCVDYAVYTAGMGRQFRTCYNKRDNDKYKVPITLDELEGLTPELYDTYCSAPRGIAHKEPKFKAKFAIIVDAARHKIGSIKRKPKKPVSLATLQSYEPTVKKLMDGKVIDGAGFNKIAIQLAIYAREVGLSLSDLIVKSYTLIQTHAGDGFRYNTPAKREAEIKRMFNYISDNDAYEFALAPITSLIATETVVTASNEDGEEELEKINTQGVEEQGGRYVAAKAEGAIVAISNFVFTDIVKLLDIDSGEIVVLRAKIVGPRISGVMEVPTTLFTNAGAIQNAVSKFGGVFTGLDAHARGVFQLMLYKISDTKFVINSEGINYVKIPEAEDENLRNGFLVYADKDGVRIPDWVALNHRKLGFEFVGWPDPRGVIQTDLTSCQLASIAFETPSKKRELAGTLKALFNCQMPDVIGKVFGWMFATAYRPLFHTVYGKFPLLHVYGPAGAGKTETVITALSLFYYVAEKQTITPESTAFSLQTLLAGSSSIPIVLDEYKPHVMSRDKIEQFRGILRSAYNMKTSVRAGGNQKVSSFGALSTMQLSAPLVYIAEAMEVETALMDRSVIVSVRKSSPERMAKNYKNFTHFYRNSSMLSSLGFSHITNVVQTGDLKAFADEFNALEETLMTRFALTPEEITELQNTPGGTRRISIKASITPRMIFNHTVALFGLKKFKALLIDIFGEADFTEQFGTKFNELAAAMLESLLQITPGMVPEYIKVLSTMATMTWGEEDRWTPTEGQDYALSELGGKPVLVLGARAMYWKYAVYCSLGKASVYYPNDASFIQGLRETPQFIQEGGKIGKTTVETVILDLEALAQAGVPQFKGKFVEFPRT